MLNQLSPTAKAMAYMVISMFFFGLMNNFVRQATLEMHSLQLLFFRCCFGAILIGLWIYASGHAERLKTNRLPRHILRASLGVAAMGCWFYSLAHMPLNDATALSFTTPIFVTLLAILFLKEPSSFGRWGSVMLGLVGTWIILQPGTGAELGLPAICALISAALLGFISVLLKIMTRSEHPDTISFYNVFLMTPIALPIALYVWEPLTLAGIGWAFLVAFMGSLAHLYLMRAMKLAELTLLIPFDFTRLIFTAFFAYFWFGETLSELTLVGAAIIIAASVWGVAEGNQAFKQRVRRLLSFYRD